MRILLLGANGLMGHAIQGVFGAEHDVSALSHGECDITNNEALKIAIKKHKPELVINAAGYTNVDSAESNRPEAFAANASAVKNLCEILKDTGIPLVHFSTDYVFDGKNPDGYNENAVPKPVGVYAQSKAAGEKYILEKLKNYYLIRTAWLFGPGGKNFVESVVGLRNKNPSAPLKIVNDQIGNPTFTFDVARALLPLVETKKFGIYHIVNSGNVSWYEFALVIFKQMGVPQEIVPITSAQLNRPAKRPMCSILKNTKLPKLRSFKDALGEYLHDKILIL